MFKYPFEDLVVSFAENARSATTGKTTQNLWCCLLNNDVRYVVETFTIKFYLQILIGIIGFMEFFNKKYFNIR